MPLVIIITNGISKDIVFLTSSSYQQQVCIHCSFSAGYLIKAISEYHYPPIYI